jgi:hypothetical protein
MDCRTEARNNSIRESVIRNDRNFRERLGCFSFRSAYASIWRMRSRHREMLTDLFQRVVGVHANAEAHVEHAFFAWGQ